MEESEMGNLQIITSSVINQKLKELKKKKKKHASNWYGTTNTKNFLKKRHGWKSCHAKECISAHTDGLQDVLRMGR